MTRLASVCPDCGAAFHRDGRANTAGAYCDDCRPKDDGARRPARGTTAEQGYGARWQALSRKARALSPFCEDCGTTDDLTADHSTEAWRRHDAGLSIRLEDVAVVCRRCNSERGAARGDRASDQWRGPVAAGLGSPSPGGVGRTGPPA